jgi:uncharacterized protein YecT (DUF1311 family)
MRALVAGLLLASGGAMAQYDGPAVEACRALAKRQQEGKAEVVIDRDDRLQLARRARKAGSQPVSAVLTGNGAIVLSGAPSAELAFVCLLSDEKRAVYFDWLPRGGASALAACTRDPGLRERAQACLEGLQQTAEQELQEVYARRFQQANESGGAALDTYRRSNDAWRAYVDAECARRGAQAGGKAAQVELACRVELIRRRAAEMR